MEKVKFSVPYWISNNGDGSASIRLCATIKDAEKLDEAQSEGWGECCAGELKFELKDGKLCYKGEEFNDDADDKWDNSKYVNVELAPYEK